MPIIINQIFDAEERPLKIFNEVAVIDLVFAFTVGENCQCLNGTTEEYFTFPNFASAYFRVYNERLGRRIKNITLTQSGNSLVMNASSLDMTFDTNGRYYYEIGYTQTGGYEFPLRYGVTTVI